MKSRVLSLVVLIIAAISAACSAASIPEKKPGLSVPSEIQAPQTSKENWEKEWERLLQGAKKEGRLVIFSTGGSEIRDALIKGFRERYIISPEVTTGKGAEITVKLQTERNAGIYSADVYVGGAGTLVSRVKPSGSADPLEPALLLPEVVNPQAWWKGELDWIDKDHYLLAFIGQPKLPVTINTRLVGLEEIKSYRDLLAPKWKGKIILNDPTETGAGAQLVGVIGLQIMGMDYIRELVRQEPIILRDQRLQMEWLAWGKYPVAVYAKTDVVPEFVSAGAPLKNINMKEGTFMNSASGNLALINKAPHPNAARLFINWLLSREGQTAFAKAQGGQSGRVDVPIDFLDPEQLRVPGMKYFDGYSEQYNEKKLEYTRIAEEIFGQLMK